MIWFLISYELTIKHSINSLLLYFPQQMQTIAFFHFCCIFQYQPNKCKQTIPIRGRAPYRHGNYDSACMEVLASAAAGAAAKRQGQVEERAGRARQA